MASVKIIFFDIDGTLIDHATGRMSENTILTLKKLQEAGCPDNIDYSKMPAYDDKMEAMLPVIHREIPLKAHVHRADDILLSTPEAGKTEMQDL